MAGIASGDLAQGIGVAIIRPQFFSKLGMGANEIHLLQDGQ